MVGFLKSTAATLFALVSLTSAQTTTACATNICVAGIAPESGNDIYLSITAPAKDEDLGWVGVGFGTRMKDALVFIVYPNEAGTNLTISPRLATGNMMPEHDDSIELTVLGGTGIAADGSWTANFICHTCASWGDAGVLSLEEQPIIWAEGNGQSVASDDLNAVIDQHGRRGGGISLMLSEARGDPGANPFVSGGDTGSEETGGATRPAAPTGTAPTGGNPTRPASGNEDKEGGAGMRWSREDRMLLAHGMLVLAGAVWIWG